MLTGWVYPVFRKMKDLFNLPFSKTVFLTMHHNINSVAGNRSFNENNKSLIFCNCFPFSADINNFKVLEDKILFYFGHIIGCKSTKILPLPDGPLLFNAFLQWQRLQWLADPG